MPANVIPPEQAPASPPPPPVLDRRGPAGERPGSHRGDVRRHCSAVRPAEPGAECRVRPTMAGPCPPGARVDRVGRPGGCLHGYRGCRDGSLAVGARAEARDWSRFLVRNAPPRASEAPAGTPTPASFSCRRMRRDCPWRTSRPTPPRSRSVSETCSSPIWRAGSWLESSGPAAGSRFSSSGCHGRPWFRRLYRWYAERVLPRIGALVSNHRSAYAYLPESVGRFPPPEQFGQLLQDSGFPHVAIVPLTLGIVYLYVARK